MAIKVSHDGDKWILMDGVQQAHLELHLYQNNFTPVAGPMSLGDFVEADFSGYAAETLDAGDWAVPSIVANHAQTSQPTKQFTHDGGPTDNNIFGIYVTDQPPTVVLWAERDPAAPVVMDPGANPYNYTPVVTSISEF